MRKTRSALGGAWNVSIKERDNEPNVSLHRPRVGYRHRQLRQFVLSDAPSLPAEYFRRGIRRIIHKKERQNEQINEGYASSKKNFSVLCIVLLLLTCGGSQRKTEGMVFGILFWSTAPGRWFWLERRLRHPCQGRLTALGP